MRMLAVIGPRVEKWVKLLIGLAVVGVALAVGIEWVYNNYFTDDLLLPGSRYAVSAWVAKDDVVNRLITGRAPTTKESQQMNVKFAIWVVGDDAAVYASKIDRPCWGNADSWRNVNVVLIVRLRRAGRQKVHFNQRTNFGGGLEGADHWEEVETYNADAWLVDRETRVPIGYKFIEAGASGNGSVGDNRFFCVRQARTWAEGFTGAQ